MTASETHDYIVIGAGTAGCLLADRLTEDGTRNVCVIEAGPRDSHPFIHMPAGYIKTLVNPRYTWQFTSEPSEGTANRPIPATQGRTLGGSSSINGMCYNRGQRTDYDSWAQRGNPGWSYDDLLPLFRRTERRLGTGGDDAYRGRSGGLPVSDLDWPHTLCDAFVEAAVENGIPRNTDYNGPDQAGAGFYQRVIEGGRRRSAARSFLGPARRRGNLRLISEAVVKRIQFDGRRATGVVLMRADGTEHTIRAEREVILCGGALNSPRLLQISGVGPSDLLNDLGAPVVHDLPGVGANLQDHWAIRATARVKGVRTINRMTRGLPLMMEAVKYALRRPSVLSLSPSLAYAFWKSDPALDQPDIQFTFAPASFAGGIVGLLDSYDGMTCGAWQQRPESKGHVRARSLDPRETPEIQPNYLSAETDRRVIVSAVRWTRKLMDSKAMAPYLVALESPGAEVTTDDEILDYARTLGSTVFHFISTCRMGPETDPMAVVGPDLKVHGIDGLRVVDASIMPSMPSANTMAATYVIAEKAADTIIGAT
ncbi:GMC family oxidoreductase [Roseovarius indicus]|uniref:Alcohol dehydrogenase [acceptor] n=1 Tax=Roseovarius indicus TaxID=540747 RepID=A0A0T5PBQ5_9RHOB|nr:GMC family oxidoreductase N-terminal domain-containing protein [Roseovarius indicus]KRS18474.1 choline dehydrogenase [Roseovarius indicus]QEW25455.1 Alcohol dehydrogenase [acceptor] [Roseovarius indicus]SFE04928.1 choline dehydrogenase [Roseovarius indicus]